MAIVLEQNKYVRPTEIREDVVQAFCDAIMEKYLAREQGEGRVLEVKVGFRLIMKRNKDIIHSYYVNEGDICLRTSEVALAFELFESAGYYIYEIQKGMYVFTAKPFLGHPSKTKFNIFID